MKHFSNLHGIWLGWSDFRSQVGSLSRWTSLRLDLQPNFPIKLPKTSDKQTLNIAVTAGENTNKSTPQLTKEHHLNQPNNHVFGFNMLVDSGGVSSKKRWQDLGSHALVRPSNCPRVTDKSICILSRILDFETERCICGSSKQHVPVSTRNMKQTQELKYLHHTSIKPRKSNIAPEKWWLEDDPFLLGFR